MVVGSKGLKVIGGDAVEQHQRRQVPFMEFKNGYKYPDDMDADLEALDDYRDRSIGPFGVFPLGESPQSQETQLTPVSIASASSYVAPTADTLLPRELWLHPRLQVDASLTYKIYTGEYNAEVSDWEQVKREIFAGFYGLKPHNRILDRMNMDDGARKAAVEEYLRKFIVDVDPGYHGDSVTGILQHPQTRHLVKEFRKLGPSLMHIMCKNSIFNTVMVPTLFKALGEMLIKKPTGTEDIIDLIKQTFILEALAMATIDRYRTLFDISGDHECSLQKLRCFIYLREANLYNLSRIFMMLATVQDGKVKVTNHGLLDYLLEKGVIDQLLMMVILALKQEESTNIYYNNETLFSIAMGLHSFLDSRQVSSSVRDLMLWIRYLNLFFRSTSIIDMDKYESQEENYYDPDSFAMSEQNYTRIEIKQVVMDSWEPMEVDNVPKKLLERPPVVDKPPRTYTIRFNYGPEFEEEEDSEPESDSDAGPIRFDASRALPFSSVELSFGIPYSLLSLMERTVELSDHRNYILRKRVFPRNFPKQCCDIEEELRNWKHPWQLYEAANGSYKFSSPAHQAVYHLSTCFYNTILMFFFRIVKETHPRRLQEHVVSTVRHLENLRSLAQRTRGVTDMRVGLPFWCFFVAGSDAMDPELQQRYDVLGKSFFDAGEKWIGKQALFEIWRGRNSSDDELRDASWLDLVKYWHIGGYI
ncbi:hypothetical protein OGAPHI_002030 [Ogataea philodendri]|uniref:Uncharacterized protein n=1 Tax=Ogataea philodendri TaxID=1378263 RepID=A0A9P8PAP1_9ASCO|nr:uncharacterized protein OGAPHI_002030 [Ogataea philodendri]KAH3668276.1 hypothetical protein OGAPHI_002030 [Ogataea philodendri]